MKLESDEESIDLIYLAKLSSSCRAVWAELQTHRSLREKRLKSIISCKIKTAVKYGGFFRQIDMCEQIILNYAGVKKLRLWSAVTHVPL